MGSTGASLSVTTVWKPSSDTIFSNARRAGRFSSWRRRQQRPAPFLGSERENKMVVGRGRDKKRLRLCVFRVSCCRVIVVLLTVGVRAFAVHPRANASEVLRGHARHHELKQCREHAYEHTYNSYSRSLWEDVRPGQGSRAGLRPSSKFEDNVWHLRGDMATVYFSGTATGEAARSSVTKRRAEAQLSCS